MKEEKFENDANFGILKKSNFPSEDHHHRTGDCQFRIWKRRMKKKTSSNFEF